MKFSVAASALLAVLPAVLASPLEPRNVTIAGGVSPDFADGAIMCQTTSTSPFVVDAQSAIKYLKGLPKNQACVTNQSSDGDRYAVYRIDGNAGLIGVGPNQKCSAVTVNCNKLATYYQKLLSQCSQNGKVQGYQYLPPNEWQLTKPGSCQKSGQDFYIEIYKYNP